MLFQILWHLGSGKITPFLMGITQMINCLTKSKTIITTLNRLGLCCSYDTMRRVDIDIAGMIIEKAGNYRCPVNDNIKPGYPIQGAMDNFNHQERTNSGSEVSNDTVLVIFQNRCLGPDVEEPKELSTRKPVKSAHRQRNLSTILPCQELERSGLLKKTGDIPENFTPIFPADTICPEESATKADYFAWSFCRGETTNS